MDCIVPGVTKSRTQLSSFYFVQISFSFFFFFCVCVYVLQIIFGVGLLIPIVSRVTNQIYNNTFFILARVIILSGIFISTQSIELLSGLLSFQLEEFLLEFLVEQIQLVVSSFTFVYDKVSYISLHFCRTVQYAMHRCSLVPVIFCL